MLLKPHSWNRAPIAPYADRLLAAEGLVLVYPVWNEGFPATLKGFFDRVFIPGVSFKIGPDGAPVPNLQLELLRSVNAGARLHRFPEQRCINNAGENALEHGLASWASGWGHIVFGHVGVVAA